MKPRHRKIPIGLAQNGRKYPQIFDLGEVPAGLKPGQKCSLAHDEEFSTFKYPKGHKVKFVGYAVHEVISLSNDYRYTLYRVAVFRLGPKHTAYGIEVNV